MRSEGGVLPSKHMWQIAKENRWLYNGVVYRGVRWNGWNYKPYDSPFGKIRINKTILLEPKILSWTKTRRRARMYTISNGTIPLLPKETVLYYAKRRHSVGVVLKGAIKDGIDIDKAIDKLSNSKIDEVHDLAMELPGLFEQEVLGVVTKAKIVEYIDYRLL